MAVTARVLRLLAAMRHRTDTTHDALTRDLVKAYADAWDTVAADLEAAVTSLDQGVTGARALRVARLRDALDVIAARLDELARTGAVLAVADLAGAVADATRTESQMIADQLPPDTPEVRAVWDRVDQASLDAIIQRTTQRIHAQSQPLSARSVAVMRAEIVRGLAVGANPRETAARIMGRCQGEFEGGAARALRIARTETLDAMRHAARVTDLANPTVAGWTWVASLSGRTCPACWGMHGTTHPTGEAGPLGHPNCRCARAPITKSWADLGHPDLDEPADAVPDAAATFAGLTRDQQISILGPTRYQAWARGQYPLHAWATKTTNPGWRDSYITSRVAG